MVAPLRRPITATTRSLIEPLSQPDDTPSYCQGTSILHYLRTLKACLRNAGRLATEPPKLTSCLAPDSRLTSGPLCTEPTQLSRSEVEFASIVV